MKIPCRSRRDSILKRSRKSMKESHPLFSATSGASSPAGPARVPAAAAPTFSSVISRPQAFHILRLPGDQSLTAGRIRNEANRNSAPHVWRTAAEYKTPGPTQAQPCGLTQLEKARRQPWILSRLPPNHAFVLVAGDGVQELLRPRRVVRAEDGEVEQKTAALTTLDHTDRNFHNRTAGLGHVQRG